jgi:hypothetical protein
MGRPCTDRPSVSVCTGTGTGAGATGRSVGNARIALGDSDGDGGGAGGEASREADGDGVPAARGGAPLVAGAVGEVVVARAAGAPALAGRLPPQAGATSALAARARQIGGRTNMMVAPSSHPSSSCRPVGSLRLSSRNARRGSQRNLLQSPRSALSPARAVMLVTCLRWRSPPGVVRHWCCSCPCLLPRPVPGPPSAGLPPS